MRRLLPAVVVAGALLIPQHDAHAIWASSTCGGSTLEACVDFSLTKDGDTYFFRVTNTTLEIHDGVITAIGMYDRSGDFSPADFGDIETSNGVSWSANTNNAACHLSGGGGGPFIFAACASSDPSPVHNGIAAGDWVQFSFTLKDGVDPDDFEAAFDQIVSGRAHLQSLGITECSIKLDSQQGAFSEGNCEGTPVPEPGTMLLLGTGLAGVLGMGAIRRRREDEVTEDEVA